MATHRLFAGRLYVGREFVVTLYHGVGTVVLGPGGRVARSRLYIAGTANNTIYSPGTPIAAVYVPGSSLTEVQD